MFCKNIHLSINPFTFNKYCINYANYYLLLYLTVMHYQNKTWCSGVFFQYKFYGFVMFSLILITHPKFRYEN